MSIGIVAIFSLFCKFFYIRNYITSVSLAVRFQTSKPFKRNTQQIIGGFMKHALDDFNPSML